MSRREQWADTNADTDYVETVRLDQQEHRHDHADRACADVDTNPCGCNGPCHPYCWGTAFQAAYQAFHKLGEAS